MRVIITIVSALLFLLPASFCADRTAEGSLLSHAANEVPRWHVERGKVYFDGAWVRMEANTEGPDLVILEKLESRSYYTIFPQNKTYSRALVLWPEDSQASALLPCLKIPEIICEKVGEDTVRGGKRRYGCSVIA